MNTTNTIAFTLISIAITIALYYFGQMVGRKESRINLSSHVDALTSQCREQHRQLHEQGQRIAELTSTITTQQAVISSRNDLSVDERHTVLRAGHELKLAAKTFATLGSPEHARTSLAIAEACFAMAKRYESATVLQFDLTDPDLPVECSPQLRGNVA